MRLATRLLVAVALIASLVAVTAPSGTKVADAQGGLQLLEVWGIEGGIVPNPKQWKFKQSTSAANDVGSAAAADPALNDTSWENRTLRFVEFPGPNVANHFRKDFDLDALGVELFQIVGIRVQLQYDDSAVLYLNGEEVYRSIRGNLDPTYATYAIGDDFPFNVDIPHGGAEELYIQIPDPDGLNYCEWSGPTCPTSPYGGPQPPEIPISLLVDGVNTWGVTTWNQSGGGSGDSTLNHVFELVIDENAVPPNTVFINEVMASNSTYYGVDLEDGPELEYPDWFELINTGEDPVNLAGWTVSDSATSWVFPSVTIGAGDYLVVVANDGDNTTTNPLQTNFKLSSTGDALKLITAQGYVADEYAAIPEQFADGSYGRVRDTGEVTYLATPSFLERNSVAGNGYAPIVRPFADRLYNQGESVSHKVRAFDPDGDTLTYAMTSGPPGVTIDSATGLVTGTTTAAGTYSSEITVTDQDGQSVTIDVDWTVFPAVTGVAPIVLNEYNAVPADGELLSGSPVGNGGDWFEFVVVEDELDLRGYTFEFFDRKGAQGQLRAASTLTIANRAQLGRIPSGTIITIGEDRPNDLSFDAVTDWSIHLNVSNDANGNFFRTAEPDLTFNSTRTDQAVLIRNAAGEVVTPLSGETEAWGSAAGGVSSGEVMNLCVNPRPARSIDPVADYLDNGTISTFGEPNQCRSVDPAVTFNQNLSVLRSGASLGVGNGDVNCDQRISIADAILITQLQAGIVSDTGPCLLKPQGVGQVHVAGGDVNTSTTTTIQDAIIIVRCTVGIPSPACP